MRNRASFAASFFAVLTIGASMLVAPAADGIVGGDPATRRTLYFHSIAPVSTAEGAVTLAREDVGPAMDETAPGPGTPKVATLSAGNPEYRKNFLLSFWSGAVRGHVTNARVIVYVGATTSGSITASLFGDGIVGVGGLIGRGSAEITEGQTEPAFIDIPVDAHVGTEMVVQLDASVTGGAALYDSDLTPSNVSFNLGIYNPPPPPVLPVETAGFGPVRLVHGMKANRETSIAINPANNSQMLICDPSGVPALGEGHSYYHLSNNAGAAWSPLDNEPATSPDDTREYAYEGGDCDVEFDAAGTMYTADTWLGDLSLGASRDGGASWTGTAVAAGAIVDRPWLVGGPAGTIHVTYHDVQALNPSAMWYTRSTDYGKTFLPPVLITTVAPEGAFSWEGNFVVSPDASDLYLVYTRRQGPALGSLDDQGPETVWVAASHDGGLTWAQNLVASMPNPASYLYPSIALDKGGMLHVVYSSRTSTHRPIWYATSQNEAITWSVPRQLISSGSGFSPWIAANQHGDAVVQWLGSPNSKAALGSDEDWYIYVARITGAQTGSPVVTVKKTTQTPLFRGKHTAIPEFNMVRLDASGKAHIGASVYRTTGTGTGWAIYYQAEI